MTVSNRPLPRPDEDSEEYWAFCAAHELRMQCCEDCGYIRFSPSVVCPRCLSTGAEWKKLSGKGRIHSFVVVHNPMVPGYDEVPYVVALVDLDEGPRMTTRIVDCQPEDVSVDAVVQVSFEDVSENLSLPLFVLAKSDV